MHFEYFLSIIIIILILLWLRKKIKKYKSIYNINGFDGIYLYFINKNFKKSGLSNFIDKKYSLGKEISRFHKIKPCMVHMLVQKF